MKFFKLPSIKLPKIKGKIKKRPPRLLTLVIVISCVAGFLAGTISGIYFYFQTKILLENLNTNLPQLIKKEIVEKEIIKESFPQALQEGAIVKAVKDVSPAVVSIVISKDVAIIEEYFYNPFEEFEQFFGPEFQVPQYRQEGIEKQEIGGGTGVIISKEGMIITNRHLVLDEDAEYTVFTNDGRKFSARVLARDPVQDLAVMKIEQEKTVNDEGKVVIEPFSTAKLGDSDNLDIGQTVIAIGNALGEFRNTVSVGVISGLGRTITASGGGIIETLEDVIQTDAAINRGNSGGPLLNLDGEVIGINTAMALEAQSIGFAIPINKAKRDIEQVQTSGKIVYPFLGVRYVLITETVQKDNNLAVDYGALIVRGEAGESAIFEGSVAEKAGLKEGDIILEFNNEKITQENSLAKIIMKYNPGDKVVLKILRGEKEITVEVTLGERSE
jgi:serine protease Do